MKPEEQRIAIAEACGWRWVALRQQEGLCDEVRGCPPDVDCIGLNERYVPNHPNDLNAIHEAITQHGNGPQWMEFRSEFTRNLLEVVRRGPNYLDGTASWYFATATPMQLAEAFLRTLNLWKA